MKKKISFHNMPHSDPMEKHANEKLNKIEEYLQKEEWRTPHYIELWLKANKLHPHHEVEFHLKTPQFNLYSQAKGPDMYNVIDTAIDKMLTQLTKEKNKIKDKHQKVETPKKEFTDKDDKYSL